MMRLPWFLLAACSAAPSTPIAHRGASDEPLELTTFWAGKPRDGIHRSCAVEDMQAILARPAESPTARADVWGSLLQTCGISWSRAELTGVRAQIDFGAALLGAGYPNDCLAAISSAATPYAGGLRGRDIPELEGLQEELDQLLEKCADAHEAKLARFKATPCPGAECLELDGRAHRGEDDAVLHCAGLMLGGRPLVVEDGPLVGEFCCGIGKVTMLWHRGVRFVRARGPMFTRVCGGGTASATPDAVYRLAGDKLVLEHDFSIEWH